MMSVDTIQLATAVERTEADPLISIVIKTLNEEQNIGRTLKGINAVTKDLTVEVIVADSLSTDRTVTIALSEGVQVVQLRSAIDRCCGVGAQLGFQVARGKFVFIIDGDMELVPGFIEAALEVFDRDPSVAGVAGQVVEMTTDNRVFVNRLQRNKALTAVGPVDRLDMGGMYRASALRDAGYFTHRGLHSCEELELGCRLVSMGWSLNRLATPSVRHWGHSLPRYRLLWRRVRSKYFLGPGELLRASIGHPWLPRVLRAYRAYLAMLPLWLWLVAGVMLVYWNVWVLVTAVLCAVGLFGIAAVRRRDFSDGLYAFVAWNVFAVGVLRGFLRSPVDPTAPIDYLLIER